MAKPLIGISSCLLGFCVRYDGKSNYDPCIALGLADTAEFLAICPEEQSGMSIPREPMDLYEVSGEVRLITVNTGRDMTVVLRNWVENQLSEMKELPIKGFILKSGSPSCGFCSARIHRNGVLYRNGTGIFSHALKRSYPDIPAVQDTDLNSPDKIASFIELTGGYRAES